MRVHSTGLGLTFISVLVFCVLDNASVFAQSTSRTVTPEDVKGALAGVEPELARELDDLNRFRWVYAGSVIGAVLLPPTGPVLIPVGTVLSSTRALEAGEDYRHTVSDVLGEDPLPQLDGGRTARQLGVMSYAAAGLAFTYTIFAGIAAIGDGNPGPIDSPHVQVSGGIGIGTFFLGIGFTAYSTWNAYHTTAAFHDEHW
jgi:hypothetical protein